ncbi:MAG: PadR family transcriptional regulator [Flammeovirgaceae bacterium]|nr:PadR family transcriptional regulator [Flammeovirgaceae bacterium]MBR09214.1 PadR family transcriptional regulator [Rickettsiales bacterium]HCX24371.1 PadR family transcriptional regulator [Cytophagales bacterium]|tara:strand:- start:148 stop:480 length:333 start_codon:yes stop_codon:yes gene_type:complete
MENIKLGNFEELILLLVALLYDKAYSVSIVEEYEKQTGKSINISAIHTVLYRLEKKSYLESRLGEAKSERGGKRKRLFYLTTQGANALNEIQNVRDQLRSQIPSIAFPTS